MIILMDQKDDTVNYFGTSLANKYNETTKVFGNQQIDLSQEQRVTFYGHASTQRFSRELLLTPGQFAQQLIDNYNLPKDKPITLDLIGCAIGLLENNQSYAQQVAGYLFNKGYFNVAINAINNLAIEENASGMTLAPNFNDSVTVSYLPTSSKIAYDNELKKKMLLW